MSQTAREMERAVEEARSPEQARRTAAVVDAVARKLLAGPLIVNHFRGCVVEAIVAEALKPDWNWCSEDWGGWDFDRGDGRKLEVKQSAARQTWSPAGAKPSRAVFDVALRQGRYGEASAWIDGHGRWADIYVFAHHPIIDATADHRDPHQWTFHVVPTVALPIQDTLSLAGIRKLAPACGITELRAAVDRVANRD